MKKNISINLFGTLYQIDEDAYKLLERYIESMKSYFSRQEGGEEIADDIEHRVAELLWDKQQAGVEAVDIDMVKEIIATIGNPAEIEDDSKGSTTADSTSTSSSFTESNTRNSDEPLDSHQFADGQQGRGTYQHNGYQQGENMYDRMRDHVRGRRLYRDGQDKMLGGVCSGLAHYFGVGDSTMWRLGTLVLSFLLCSIDAWWVPGFITIMVPIAYVICWIVVPIARTPEDMLRRSGKEVNPENINQEILHESEESSRMAQQAYQPAPQNNGGCLKVLFVCFLLVLLFPLLLVLILVLFGISITGGIMSGLLGDVFVNTPFHMLSSLMAQTQGMVIAVIFCGFMVVIIPIFLIIRWLRGSSKPMSTATVVFLIVLWILAFIFGLIGIGRVSMKAVEMGTPFFDVHYSVTRSNDPFSVEIDSVLDEQMEALDDQMEALDDQMEALDEYMDEVAKKMDENAEKLDKAMESAEGWDTIVIKADKGNSTKSKVKRVLKSIGVDTVRVKRVSALRILNDKIA